MVTRVWGGLKGDRAQGGVNPMTDEDDEFGLNKAIERLPVCLRNAARTDFWDAVGRQAIELIDTFKYRVSDTGHVRTVALFHVVGDVFCFEILQLRNANGQLVPVVSSASLDELPSKRAIQKEGYYYVE